MTLIVDAAPVVALADVNEPRRDQVLHCLEEETGPLIVPAQVAAEVDYLLGQRFGRQARRAFLADLATGRFIVGSLAPEDYLTILSLEDRYADLDLGLADCSLIVLAAEHGTDRLLTFDERHFRAVSPLRGSSSFTVLPAGI